MSAQKPMAVVSIDHSSYLLPRSSAIKVAELMADAIPVSREYHALTRSFCASEHAVDVHLIMVLPDEVDFSARVVTPAKPSSPKLRALPDSQRRLK